MDYIIKLHGSHLISHQQTVRFSVCFVSKSAEGAAEVRCGMKMKLGVGVGRVEWERANTKGRFGVR